MQFPERSGKKISVYADDGKMPKNGNEEKEAGRRGKKVFLQRDDKKGQFEDLDPRRDEGGGEGRNKNR